MAAPAALISLVILCFLPRAVDALDWQSGPGYRSASLPVASVGGRTGFTRLTPPQTGITFTNYLSDERSITNRNLLSGSGVAVGDVDGDGLCDIYFCSLATGNTLFRNRGQWRFENMTAAAGVACPNQDSTGAAFADVDGDGDLDLLVNSLGHGTRLFLNDGKGHFREATAEAGLVSKTGSTSMALADVDGDGDLDLYVANFRPKTVKDEPSTRFRLRVEKGAPMVVAVNDRPATEPDLTNRFVVSPSGTVLEQGEVDVLYLNDGAGKFSPVSFTDGHFLDEQGIPLKTAPQDWGLAVQFHDFTGDGAPDIYVCNDLHTPDRIWVNDGKGRFRAISNEAIRCTSVFSMGVDMADIDRDGNVDIFVVDMFSREQARRQIQVATTTPVRWPVGSYDYRPQINRNTLQLNRGDGTFAESAWFSGVEASEWSWGPIFLDVDLDGYEDIVVMNGQLRDFQNADLDRRIAEMKSRQRMSMMEILRAVKLFPRLESPKLIFRNRGDRTFEEVGARWGFASTGIAQGMALADLDNDGDLDIVTNNLNEPAGIYRNESDAGRVAVRLKGIGRNSKGIGARIHLLGGAVAMQDQEVICGGRYLSGDEPVRVFAAGTSTNRLAIEVSWRSGRTSRINDVLSNRIYEIDESNAKPPGTQPGSDSPGATGARGSQADRGNGTVALAVFEDVSEKLNHTHVEDAFDDFERQPLLLRRLSQPGPGVCWHDLDGDGWDDLVISSGRTGQLSAFHNDQHGGFTLLTSPALHRPVTRDQTAVLVPALNTLMVGSSNDQDGLTNGGALRIYDLARNVVGDAVLGQLASTGPVVMSDVDGDGDLDVFIGGRGIPARYPEPATSLLMRNEGGRLVAAQRFERFGLVNGAVFSDLDGDGRPELVLACDWGAVRVLKNENGVFVETTQQLGLAEHKGWWQGVAVGDLDSDGRMDIVAANWGWNSMFHTNPAHPRRFYFGDLDGNGIVDLIDATYDDVSRKYVPARGLKIMAAALPMIQERISSFEAYANAGVEEIYGDRLRTAQILEVTTLASTIFFNRGDHFEPAPLPPEAQLAPACGVAVGDMDGDGMDDVFLSQNFFGVNPDTQPCAAGRGLWLKGDGHGHLSAVPGQVSGVRVYGEQRGCALADYDQDGRMDLVVTQNGNRTKLYHNVQARPGLRVRLLGPEGNPTAVGACLRLESQTRQGPLREVHAGSGYLSDDSPVQVLSLSESATRLWVRWPGGKQTTVSLPAGAAEVSVSEQGNLKVLR
ncbi:MAG: FG-GAP-like repeat-containing protein [Verrucomicrobiota bacterium]